MDADVSDATEGRTPVPIAGELGSDLTKRDPRLEVSAANLSSGDPCRSPGCGGEALWLGGAA
jgi:hypothetical protein